MASLIWNKDKNQKKLKKNQMINNNYVMFLDNIPY